jgi:CHASE2 domain-containing sensor protein
MARIERRIKLLVSIAVLAFAVGVALHVADAFGPTDRWVSDRLMRWRDEPRVPTEIVTVALDASATRTMHARAITRLHRAGAKVIAYDVAFERSRSRREDERLLRALRRARSVVLGALVGDRNKAGYILPRLFRRPAELDAAGVRVGFAAYPREPDGRIRRVAVTPLGVVRCGRPQTPNRVDAHNMRGVAY